MSKEKKKRKRGSHPMNIFALFEKLKKKKKLREKDLKLILGE